MGVAGLWREAHAHVACGLSLECHVKESLKGGGREVDGEHVDCGGWGLGHVRARWGHERRVEEPLQGDRRLMVDRWRAGAMA